MYCNSDKQSKLIPKDGYFWRCKQSNQQFALGPDSTYVFKYNRDPSYDRHVNGLFLCFYKLKTKKKPISVLHRGRIWSMKYLRGPSVCYAVNLNPFSEDITSVERNGRTFATCKQSLVVTKPPTHSINHLKHTGNYMSHLL
jgi:hypothetical protein